MKRLSTPAYRVTQIIRSVEKGDEKKLAKHLEKVGFNMTKGAIDMIREQLKGKKKAGTCPVCKYGWEGYKGNYDELCNKHYLKAEPTG